MPTAVKAKEKKAYPRMLSILLFLATTTACLVDLASAAKGSDKKEPDPLEQINKEIAALEAKMSAIEHIKLYADSISLQELSSRDVEQTVAHFLKTTRKSPEDASVINVSAERKANL